MNQKSTITNRIIMNKNFILSPGYISGLAQSDGSFFCVISLSSKHLFGIQFRPKFTITADLDSKYVLDVIYSYFNCGKVYVNRKNNTAEFEVSTLKDLKNIIIPHFNKFPVFCAKLHAFKLFIEIVSALCNKEKRNREGRIELLKQALSMNVTTNRSDERINLLFNLLYKDLNLNSIEIDKNKDKSLIPNTITTINTPLSHDHIAGIIDGDGSVYISFQKNGNIKTGFSITTDCSSKPLLEIIKKELKGIGSILEGTKKELIFSVSGLNQITEILIPFIDNNPLFSERALHYQKFKTVSLLLKNEQPLKLETKLKIVELAYNMNKGGKRRKLDKTQYIKLLKSIHVR